MFPVEFNEDVTPVISNEKGKSVFENMGQVGFRGDRQSHGDKVHTDSNTQKDGQRHTVTQ